MRRLGRKGIERHFERVGDARQQRSTQYATASPFKLIKVASTARKPFGLLGLHWAMLAIAGMLFWLVATFVDLRSVVDENFFFSASDPAIQQTKKAHWRMRKTLAL